MDNESLHKPMSLAKKTLLSAGGLALLAGVARPGSLAKGLIIKREQAKRMEDAIGTITDKYKNVLNAANQEFNKDLAKANKSWFFPKFKKTYVEARRFISHANLQHDKVNEIAEASGEIAKKRDQIAKELSFGARNLDKLDTVLPVVGGLSVAGTLLSEKKGAFNLQSTKETEEIKKPHVKPNLVGEPVNYTRGFQSGPIIENADKMGKIAEVITEIHNGEMTLASGKKATMKTNARQLLALHKAIKEHPDKALSVNRDGQVIFKTAEEILPKGNNLIFGKGWHRVADDNEQKVIDEIKKKHGATAMVYSKKGPMDKIAEAVNSLFPKDYKDIQIAQQEKVLSKQERAIIKRDEMLAQHEQAHAEKDFKLKQIKKAVKETSSKMQYYRQVALSNYERILDAEGEIKAPKPNKYTGREGNEIQQE